MSFQLNQLLAVMIGGAFGSVARYLLGQFTQNILGQGFPYGTLVVNVLGSFAMGFLSLLLVQKLGADSIYRFALMIGFLGAFTTFSTFSLDTVQLFQQGAHGQAVWYIISSVVFSILALLLGLFIAKTVLQ